MPKEANRESTKRAIPARRSCTLIITHQCNLNCVYCYESYKSDKSMPIQTAKQAIESEFDFVARSQEFDELAIDFMGGEPLLRFDLIREIAEWVWSVPRPVPFVLFSTTNGTLLDEPMKRWFRQHKERYYLSLSLDGTPEMHNTNRGHSFDQIDLDFFQENWPDQPVKMTVSRESVGSLAEGIIYLQERGFRVGASVGQGVPWDEESVAEYGRQLHNLAEYYLEHEQVPPVSLLEVPIQRALSCQSEGQKKYCGTGTHMVTYDVDGAAYPCHMFSPLVLGACKSNELQSIEFREDVTVTDPRCNDCALRSMCPTCYGLNYKHTGEVSFRDQSLCRLFEVQALANCWLQAQLIRRKSKEEPLSLEDARKAKACLKIMTQLSEMSV